MRLFIKWEKPLDSLNVIEVHKCAILSNFDLFKKMNPNVSIWPVLKSNAYGHGIKQIAEVLKMRDFEYIVVDSYYEALKIWETGKRPVLIIGSILPQNYHLINWKYTAIMVQDEATIRELGELNKYIKVHLKYLFHFRYLE